jgi:hypothetical protein
MCLKGPQPGNLVSPQPGTRSNLPSKRKAPPKREHLDARQWKQIDLTVAITGLLSNSLGDQERKAGVVFFYHFVSPSNPFKGLPLSLRFQHLIILPCLFFYQSNTHMDMTKITHTSLRSSHLCFNPKSPFHAPLFIKRTENLFRDYNELLYQNKTFLPHQLQGVFYIFEFGQHFPSSFFFFFTKERRHPYHRMIQ